MPLCATPKPIEAFGVQVTAPGEEAELDFGYLGFAKCVYDLTRTTMGELSQTHVDDLSLVERRRMDYKASLKGYKYATD
jgi:hypothetical protein